MLVHEKSKVVLALFRSINFVACKFHTEYCRGLGMRLALCPFSNMLCQWLSSVVYLCRMQFRLRMALALARRTWERG